MHDDRGGLGAASVYVPADVCKKIAMCAASSVSSSTSSHEDRRDALATAVALVCASKPLLTEWRRDARFRAHIYLASSAGDEARAAMEWVCRVPRLESGRDSRDDSYVAVLRSLCTDLEVGRVAYVDMAYERHVDVPADAEHIIVF